MNNLLKFIVLIFILIAASCNFTQRQTNSAKESISGSIEIDEIKRSYYLYIPKNKRQTAEKTPLLLLLHGRYGTAKHMLEGYNMNQIADREGFAVLYPNGYSRSWADGRGGTPADKNNIDDVKFLESVIRKVSLNYPIDNSNIFIAGHSNGGFMTQRILIERTNLFKAGVSVTANISKNILKNSTPKKPISVAFISGTEDPLVPYEGGFVVDGEEILGAEDSVRRWIKWNNCSPIPTKNLINEKEDATRLEIYSYTKCKDQTEVRLYKLIGAGHNWPGIPQQLPFINLGKPTEELNASEEIWSFFKAQLNNKR